MIAVLRRLGDNTQMEFPTPPGKSELHLWCFPLEERAHHRSILADAEIERANRFALERPRRQFVTARGTLRELLAGYMGCRPIDVPLMVEPDGKPYLVDCGLQFNVTHSAERGLIAVSNRRIGVDLEQIRPMPNALALVERFFGPEERNQFQRLPEEQRLHGFFRGWTCKEALFKAVGTGIQNVDRCVVDLDPRSPTHVIRFDHRPEIGEWRLLAFEPEAGYVAALALESATSIELRVEPHK